MILNDIERNVYFNLMKNIFYVERQLRDLFSFFPWSQILLSEFLELLGAATIFILSISLPLISSLAITHYEGNRLFLHVMGEYLHSPPMLCWNPNVTVWH